MVRLARLASTLPSGSVQGARSADDLSLGGALAAIRSGIAGGVAGCVVRRRPGALDLETPLNLQANLAHPCARAHVLPSHRQAKTAIAPLDRVKILFQTSNQDFLKYQGASLAGQKPSAEDSTLMSTLPDVASPMTTTTTQSRLVSWPLPFDSRHLCERGRTRPPPRPSGDLATCVPLRRHQIHALRPRSPRPSPLRPTSRIAGAQYAG
jgi:hypothetical protein